MIDLCVTLLAPCFNMGNTSLNNFGEMIMYDVKEYNKYDNNMILISDTTSRPKIQDGFLLILMDIHDIPMVPVFKWIIP